MTRLIALPLVAAFSFGVAPAAIADHSMHDVYHHHYKRMHAGAHEGHRQACIGRGAGTAHHSCGTHTGGPSGGLH